MNYFIECRNAFDRSDLEVYNDEFESIGNVIYHKQNSEHQITSFNSKLNETFKVSSNPLRLKSRYKIFNDDGNQVAKVSLGVKIIHSIIESDKYYFVKAAFWKIKYTVFDNRVVVANLDVIKRNKKRYFKIVTKNDDYLTVLSIFLLAQAVRMKVILN